MRLVLPNTDLDGAKACAEKLADQVKELSLPHPENGDFKVITVSMGISSVIPEPVITPEQVLNFVDGCMYEAKETGRNRYISRAYHS